MHKTETRAYSELRVDGNRLSGTCLRYGDTATIGGISERFERGAFGDVAALDVVLNRQHSRERPLARSGAGLTLSDSPTSLTMAAELIDTADARDTLALVRAGVLRGLSIEFRSVRERIEAGVRVIESARLTGLGVVDRAAYPESTVQARQLEIVEDRQTGPKIRGSFPYDEPVVISDRGTGRRQPRKAQWTPDSWKRSIEDLNNEIALQFGDAGRNQVIASRNAGSMRIDSTDKEFTFLADIPGDVSYIDDIVERLNSDQVIYQLRPFQTIPPPEVVAKPFSEFEEIAGSGIFIRRYENVTLKAMQIQPARTSTAGSIQVRQFEPWL